MPTEVGKIVQNSKESEVFLYEIRELRFTLSIKHAKLGKWVCFINNVNLVQALGS